MKFLKYLSSQWDTVSTQGIYLSYNPYGDASGIFLVFDLTDKDSWNNIKQWYEMNSGDVTETGSNKLKNVLWNVQKLSFLVGMVK